MGNIPSMDITRENLLALVQSGLREQAFSIAGLEKTAGVPKDTIRDFLRGKTQILRADKLQKILRVLEPEPRLMVTAVMGKDGEIIALPKEQHTESVDMPTSHPAPSLRAVRIEGSAMEPVLQPGWVICYSTAAASAATALKTTPHVPYGKEDGATPFADLLGKPCVITLADGRLMLRTLKKGEKGYTLVAYNAPDILNASVTAAYKILFIRPA